LMFHFHVSRSIEHSGDFKPPVKNYLLQHSLPQDGLIDISQFVSNKARGCDRHQWGCRGRAETCGQLISRP
jgi:hypothetical protein